MGGIKELIDTKEFYFAAGAATIALTYGVYKFAKYLDFQDEYFQTVNNWCWVKQKCTSNRRVLVLGLDGAGKTKFVTCFHPNANPRDTVMDPAPTVGFCVKSVPIGDTCFDIWDVGGAVDGRSYWREFLLDIDVVVWVVDSSASERFFESRCALHRFLRHPETRGLPVMIIASKQDCRSALPQEDVFRAMGVDIHKHNEFSIIGTSLPSTGERKGIWQAYKMITRMSPNYMNRMNHIRAVENKVNNTKHDKVKRGDKALVC
ncbi:hypothetical protein ACJMK2_006160 [Sinanodonta woodiana]|uniref:Uncharacterized protein n=1 Tax=Sinanodonta woodiana TaxID=1069815 RepID=A0ABD3VSR1_SINWO